jgi:hypothetical protein
LAKLARVIVLIVLAACASHAKSGDPAQVCPSGQPAPDSPCSLPDNTVCNYPPTGCLCSLVTESVLAWFCTPIDVACPSRMPARGAACAAAAMTTCFYEPAGMCECYGAPAVWNCRSLH